MFLVLYRHDILQSETRVLCPQFSKKLLNQLEPTLS